MTPKLSQTVTQTAMQLNEFAAGSKTLHYPQAGLPDRARVIRITEELRSLLFPGYFDLPAPGKNGYAAGYRLSCICEELLAECLAAYKTEREEQKAQEMAEQTVEAFASALPEVQKLLSTDVEALYAGDPAAGSTVDVIFSYPGLNAITVYRLAHVLYRCGLPLIPRMMTEYAHGQTGIDINAGAEIGSYFFIDHGTGVVIGETTCIGDNVKLYQGVTLGALSTRKGIALAGKKRHPTIGNRVTVYSNASILGGDTVIGDDCVIGGNVFVTRSVPAGTKVSLKAPELEYREM